MIEEFVEVFMDDFSVFGDSFDKCLNNLDKMLQRCKELILSLIGKYVTSWSKKELCLDTRCLAQDLKSKRKNQYFSKIARPLTKPLKKDTPFEFDDECQKAFELLKEKLTCAPVIISPNWNLSFKLMCDASDFVVGAVLEIEMCTGMFKDQAEVVVAQEEVQEKIDLVENEEELIEEEEQ
ncbi:reverse transcriptase domain-containing protein [Tanacetum coccineum]